MLENKIHVFERSQLGRAPFRVVGQTELIYQAYPGAPRQPGGTCDFCGTGIIYAFIVQGADGREFKVGSDCVAKTGDTGLRRQVDAAVRERKRAERAEREYKRQEPERERIAQAKQTVQKPAIRAALDVEPHPMMVGHTLLGYVEWLFANAGHAGQFRAAVIVEKIAAQF